MTVSVFLITQGNIGQTLLDAVETTFGHLPLPSVTIPIDPQLDPQTLIPDLTKQVVDSDDGDGILILTDLCGSTACNIACALAAGDQVQIVSGLNLSMLLRLMNYPDADLSTLTQKAYSGGKDGIRIIPQSEDNPYA